MEDEGESSPAAIRVAPTVHAPTSIVTVAILDILFIITFTSSGRDVSGVARSTKTEADAALVG